MSWAQFLPLVLILAIGYLLLIRPARRRARDVSTLQAALSVGDQVMLTSGIYGTITGVVDDEARIEVASGVVVRVHRAAVAKIIKDEPADDATTIQQREPDAPAAPAADGDDNEEVS